jgi:hypothetical protein
MDVRLRSRCAALLEIQFGDHNPAEVTPGMKVSYLHRTVRDYLESPNAKALLSAQARDNAKAGQDFISPSVSFLKSYILMLKAGPKGPDEAQPLIHGTLTFARRAQEDYVDSPQLLDEFFRIASPWFDRLDERPFSRNHESMLTLAT